MTQDNHTIQRLKAHCNMLDLAAALGLTLKGKKTACFNAAGHRGGSDEDPSLMFYPDGHYHCFGCGLHGDIFDLVRQLKDCSFPEAVAYVEEFVGRMPAKPELPEKEIPDPEITDAVLQCLFDLCRELASDSQCGRYLTTRGIHPDTANGCGVRELGNHDQVFNGLLDTFDLADIEDVGILGSDGHLLFEGWPLLFFYLRDGKPAYVQGRVPYTLADQKETNPTGLPCPVPYNIDALAGPVDEIILCEGCIDTLSAIQMGHVAVGVPGVQAFKPEWYGLFKTAALVRIAFDGDEAGRRGATGLHAGFKLRGIPCEIIAMPDGMDINNLLVQGGTL